MGYSHKLRHMTNHTAIIQLGWCSITFTHTDSITDHIRYFRFPKIEGYRQKSILANWAQRRKGEQTDWKGLDPFSK